MQLSLQKVEQIGFYFTSSHLHHAYVIFGMVGRHEPVSAKQKQKESTQKCGGMYVCLGIQVAEFWVSELVGENMWKRLGKLLVLKICPVSCKGNMGKNRPFGI